MNQRSALGLGLLAGAAAALFLGRRRSTPAPDASPPVDPRTDELRRQLAQARESDVDEAEFQAAGMGAETIAEEPPGREPPPSNEFEAMRRRVHEEARAAAEEMRRRAETPD